MLYQGDVPDITRCKNNWELEHICEQQWNEIEYLKQENEELKKDIAELSKMVDELYSTIEKIYHTSTLGGITMTTKKEWKVTYHLLFEAESEPSEFTCDFYYIETAFEFLKRTAEHQNLLDFKVERLTSDSNNGKILSEVE